MKKERRKMRRKDSRMTVKYKPLGGKEENIGFTENISPLGIFISCTKPIKEGTALSLYLDNEGKIVFVQGVVVWNRQIRFTDKKIEGLGFGVNLFHVPDDWISLSLWTPQGCIDEDIFGKAPFYC